MKTQRKIILIEKILLLLVVTGFIQISSTSQAASLAGTQNQTGTGGSAVTIQEDESTYTISNGIAAARISKRNGDMTSLKYKGTETLTDKSGHAGGYWSHDTTGGTETITRITIDPTSSGGQRGEVSVKGISGGEKMGHGPGAAQDGDFPADIEIRYSIGRGESGVSWPRV